MAVCKYDDNDVCLGCFRQRKDIENWFFLSPAQQQAIVTEVMPKIDAKRQQQRQVYLQQEQAKKEQP